MNRTLTRNAGWIALAIGACVALLAGVFLPPNGYLLLAAALFLVVAGVVGTLVQLNKPILGIMLLLATAIAFPIEFRAPGLGVMMSSSFPLAAVLCTVWLLHFTFISRTSLDRSRLVFAAIGVIVVSTLAFVAGQFPWFPWNPAPLPAQIAELGLFVLSVLLFLAVGHQLDSPVHLKWMTGVLIGAGFVAVVVQSVPQLSLTIGPFTTRPSSVGSLFWTWFVAMAFAQAVFNRSLTPLVRTFLLGIAVVAIGHGLIQVRSWASGWIPPLVAVGVIMFMRFPRFTVASGVIGLPLALYFFGLVSDTLLSEESYSLMTRQEAWTTLWQFVERSPLIGTGPANYYYYSENLPILGYYVRFIAHNNYQDLVVQTGFAGLIAFLWFGFEAGAMLVSLQRRIPEPFSRAYVIGALGGLVGSLVAGMLGDWIIPFYYNAGILGFRSSLLFWVFLGGILVLKRTMLAGEPAWAVAEAPRGPRRGLAKPLPVH